MSSNKITRKIRALREKTKANGCTEAEAIAAAELAAKLMDEHCISDNDFLIDEQKSATKSKGRSVRSTIWSVIALCTNTSILLDYENDPINVVFIGREPWPDVAVYLRDICEQAMDREIALFKKTTFYRSRRKPSTKRAAVNDFTNGMCVRLRGKLYELFEKGMSKALLQEAHVALAKRYPDTTSISPNKIKETYSEAMRRGWIAGGEIQVEHGVGSEGAAPSKQLGVLS